MKTTDCRVLAREIEASWRFMLLWRLNWGAYWDKLVFEGRRFHPMTPDPL